MAAKETSIQEQYMLGKGFRESARLYVQHFMWRCRLGYLLHPAISTANPDLRIVDIGTGNACWLLELAGQSPQTWRFEGFDITSNYLPAPEYLPHNVTTRIIDVFDDIPDELVERFDVVHVRAFAVIIKNNDPVPFLTNMMRLLKPGGYIQWDELDCATFHAHAPTESLTTQGTSDLLTRWQGFCRKSGLDFSYISSLADIFASNRHEVIESFRLPLSDNLRRASTDNFIMALEEIGAIASAKDVELLGTWDDYRALWQRALMETERGVSIGMDMVVIVGRKRSMS